MLGQSLSNHLYKEVIDTFVNYVAQQVDLSDTFVAMLNADVKCSN